MPKKYGYKHTEEEKQAVRERQILLRPKLRENDRRAAINRFYSRKKKYYSGKGNDGNKSPNKYS